MADIEIEMSDKHISNKEATFEFTTYGEVTECDSENIEISGCTNNSISSELECIQIEITGLKTLNKFISLEDTPLYYDNGKFFKVEDNKIVYTDIEWKDISGDINQNPELQQEVIKLIEENAKKFTEETVEEAIYIHNNDPEAHQSIQNTINANYEELSFNINLNKQNIDNLSTELDKTNDKVKENSELITGLNIYVDETNQRIDETNVNVGNNTASISQLTNVVEDNYNELNKLIADNSTAIVQNATDIQSNLEAINKNSSDISNNTLNIETNRQNIATNATNIQNNTNLINETIENLKEYSKTNEFAKVAFSGEYKDLLNIPDNLATNEYVDQRIEEVAKQIVYFDFVIVDKLPETGESNHIYLVPRTQGDKNIYDEFIWIESIKSFEFIGKTEIDLSDYYNKSEVDNILSKKSNITETGSNIIYSNSILTLNTKDGVKLSEVQIKSAPDVDAKTIHFNSNEELEVIGNLTKDGTFKYDWIGTTEEYNSDLASGLITNTTICNITDDETEYVVEGLLYIPKVTELDNGFELSWSNNQGYDNPATVIIPKGTSGSGGTTGVYTVNGKSGNVILTASDVGALPDDTVIPNVDNLATKEELNSVSSAIPDVSDFITTSELIEVKESIPDVSIYATTTRVDGLENEIESKQDKGDYALVSQVPVNISELNNDKNYATQTDIMSAIASIPQFSISIVDNLPTTGTKMVLYLVPKGSENLDIYNEYIWIEQTSTFEFIGNTAVDLTDYVSKSELDNYVLKNDLNDYARITDIPTNLSQLNNDTSYVTQTELDTTLGDISSILDNINGEVV